MDIMVDGILSQNYDFKNKLVTKLGINQQVNLHISSSEQSKSTFGGSSQDLLYVGVGLGFLAFVFYLMSKVKTRPVSFGKMS
jgi:hypothetical protein